MADDLSSPRIGGGKARCNIVRKLFPRLAVVIELNLSKFASMSFSQGLIEVMDVENSKNITSSEYDRASDLLLKILKKIDSEPMNFGLFISVLHEFSDMADELEAELIREEDSATSKDDSTTSPASKEEENSTALFRSPVAQQTESSSTSGSAIRPHESNSIPTNHGDSLTEEPGVASNGVPESQTTNGSAETVPSYTAPTGSVQGTIRQATTERMPTDQTILTEYWTFKAMTAYLQKSENENDIKVALLERDIESLKADKAISIKLLEEQEEVIAKMDADIEKLKILFEEKDKHVQALKAEIEGIQAKSSGAKEIKPQHESYQDKLNEAQGDLDNAAGRFAKAKLEKETEILKLRNQSYKDEIIRLKLQFNSCILSEEKRREKSEEAAERAKQEASRAKDEIQEAEAKIRDLQTDTENLKAAVARLNALVLKKDEVALETKQVETQGTKFVIQTSEAAVNQLQQQMSKSEEEKKNLIEKYEEEKRELTEKHAEEKREFTEKHAEEKRELTEKYAEEKRELTEKHAQEIMDSEKRAALLEEELAKLKAQVQEQ